jgi:hypothetical protein
MYNQKRELLERTQKEMNGFPGLMEKVKHEPVVEEKKSKASGKQNCSTTTPAVDSAAGAAVKKVGRPKKTVI